MRAVNLLPRDLSKHQRRAPNPLLLVGAGGGVAVVAGLGLMIMSASGTLTEKRDAVQDAQIRLQALPKPPPPPSPVDQGLAQEQTARENALKAALATRVPWDSILRRFSLVLPEDVWLTTLTAKAPAGGAVAPGAPTGFTIAGYTYSHDGVARFLSRLAVVPDLTNIQLQHSSLSELASRDVVEFSIVADVNPTAVPSS